MAHGIHQSPILIGYDGSEHAKFAIREAAQHLAGRPAIVLTAWHPYEALPAADVRVFAPAEDLMERFQHRAQIVAEEGAALARSVGLEAVAVATRGHPISRAIADTAAELNATLVVLGSHGQANLTSELMGSVAAGVVLESERPVLVMHPPAAHTGEQAAA